MASFAALKSSFEEARDVLIQHLAEYQAYTGYRVIVVFDAHMVKGIEKSGQTTE